MAGSGAVDDDQVVLAGAFDLFDLAEHDDVAGRLRGLLLVIPNLPYAGAPDGSSDADNPVVTGPFLPDDFPEWQRVPHWETAVELGILDNERATKIAQSMFTMQRGAGATMARALCQLALVGPAVEHLLGVRRELVSGAHSFPAVISTLFPANDIW